MPLKTLILHSRPTPTFLLCAYEVAERGQKGPGERETAPEEDQGRRTNCVILLPALMSGRLRRCLWG